MFVAPRTNCKDEIIASTLNVSILKVSRIAAEWCDNFQRCVVTEVFNRFNAQQVHSTNATLFQVS